MRCRGEEAKSRGAEEQRSRGAGCRLQVTSFTLHTSRLTLHVSCFTLHVLLLWLLTGCNNAPPSPRLAVHTLRADDGSLALAQAAEFDTVVQVFPWREIEPTQDQFH